MTATRSRNRRSDGSDRFVERRHQIRQRQGARRLRWVAGLALIAFLAVSVIGLLNSDVFAVENVTVDGVDRDLAEQVYRATRIEPGQPLIDVDEGVAARAVEELPWVRSADVARAWSGTVTVLVEPRVTLFALAVPDGSGYVGLDRDGVQVRRVSAELIVDSPLASDGGEGEASVPLIHGLVVEPDPGAIGPPEAALAINFLVSAPDSMRTLVQRMELVDGALHLRLVTGGVADLGDSRQLGAKYQALETILNQVDLDCLGTVDVSVPTAPSVTRTCQPAEDGGQDG